MLEFLKSLKLEEILGYIGGARAAVFCSSASRLIELDHARMYPHLCSCVNSVSEYWKARRGYLYMAGCGNPAKSGNIGSTSPSWLTKAVFLDNMPLKE